MSETFDFGRQPEPVRVTLTGDIRDTRRYAAILARVARAWGEDIEHQTDFGFTIYPRAIND